MPNPMLTGVMAGGGGGDVRDIVQVLSEGANFNYAGMSPERASEERAINRKQQLVNLLLQRSLQPRKATQAGRFIVAPGWGQGLGQLVEAAMGYYGMTELDKQREASMKAERDQITEALTAIEQAKRGHNITVPAQGPGQGITPDPTGMGVQEGDTPPPMVEGAQPTAVRHVGPTAQEIEAAYMKAVQTGNPRLISVVNAMMAREGAAALAEQAREEKVREFDVTQKRFAAGQAWEREKFEKEQELKERELAQKTSTGKWTVHNDAHDLYAVNGETGEMRFLTDEQGKRIQSTAHAGTVGQGQQVIETASGPMVVNKTTGDAIPVRDARGVPVPPKSDLPKGTHIDKESGEIFNNPGDPKDLKARNALSQDIGMVLALDTKTRKVLEVLDYIQDPKHKAGFEANFGGWNAYATSKLPWARTMNTKIEQLRDMLELSGLRAVNVDGKVGQVTVAEWPKFGSLMAKISHDIDEGEAANIFQQIRNDMLEFQRNQRVQYNNEWASQKQYYVSPDELLKRAGHATAEAAPKGAPKPTSGESADIPIVSEGDYGALPPGALYRTNEGGPIRKKAGADTTSEATTPPATIRDLPSVSALPQGLRPKEPTMPTPPSSAPPSNATGEVLKASDAILLVPSQGRKEVMAMVDQLVRPIKTQAEYDARPSAGALRDKMTALLAPIYQQHGRSVRELNEQVGLAIEEIYEMQKQSAAKQAKGR